MADARTSLSLDANFEVDTTLLSNTPPSLDGELRTSAQVGQPFEENIVVSDSDGDALVFSLREGPPDMTVDSSGMLRWLPDSADTVNVHVSVTDGTATLELSWTIVRD